MNRHCRHTYFVLKNANNSTAMIAMLNAHLIHVPYTKSVREIIIKGQSIP